LVKGDKYTTEAHQSQFEKELQEDSRYELTEEFRGIFDKDYYSQLESFYDVYNIRVSVTCGYQTRTPSEAIDTALLT